MAIKTPDRFSKDDLPTVHKITARAFALSSGAFDPLHVHMDLACVHHHISKLRLDDMLAADDFNFMHDIGGIAKHLDRETFELRDCFSPRFTAHN